MTKEEKALILIAQYSKDDDQANKAMAELIEKHNSSYKFCNDCDGLVVTEAECCMNRKVDESIDDSEESF